MVIDHRRRAGSDGDMLKPDRDRFVHAAGNGDSKAVAGNDHEPTALAEGACESMVQALAREADGQELSRHPLPSAYVAAHLARDDEGIFGDERDRDVNRSIRVGEVPLPELAPD